MDAGVFQGETSVCAHGLIKMVCSLCGGPAGQTWEGPALSPPLSVAGTLTLGLSGVEGFTHTGSLLSGLSGF